MVVAMAKPPHCVAEVRPWTALGQGGGMIEVATERVKPRDAELQVTIADGGGPLVVLVHGWPELGYSWRHQLRPLAEAGYRVIAPDMRGYGASECPPDVESYDIMALAGDVVGLIEHYGDGTPAFLVGHDWGSLVSWPLSVMRPELFAGVACLSVPYFPVAEQSLIDVLTEVVGDAFHYILYFQTEGVAEAEFDRDPIGAMREVMWLGSGEGAAAGELTASDAAERTTMLRGGSHPLPPWLSQGDLGAYASAFAKTGFRGGFNWYRNLHRNHSLMSPWRAQSVRIPAAFIAGDADTVLTSTGEVGPEHPMLVAQAAMVPDLTVTMIEGGGHWIQQERPDEVNAALLEFFASVR